MRVAFLGRMGSGKTAASQYLVNNYDCVRVSLAKPVKEIAAIRERPEDEWKQVLEDWAKLLLPDPIYGQETYWGGNVRDDLVWAWMQDLRKANTTRELYQRIGTDSGRAVNPEIWINYFRRFLPDSNIVIDDLRFQNEAKALHDLGFITIRLKTNELRRKERLINRDGGYNEGAQSHASEVELDKIVATYYLYNNGTFEELCEKIDDKINRESSVKVY